MGIFEILLLLAIALIVIPPDDLPQVLRTAGKVMRELRLASNTVMRELSSAIGDEQPYNLLPPRFDDEVPPPVSAAPPASAASPLPATAESAAPAPSAIETHAAAAESSALPASAAPSANAADTKP